MIIVENSHVLEHLKVGMVLMQYLPAGTAQRFILSEQQSGSGFLCVLLFEWFPVKKGNKLRGQ